MILSFNLPTILEDDYVTDHSSSSHQFLRISLSLLYRNYNLIHPVFLFLPFLLLRLLKSLWQLSLISRHMEGLLQNFFTSLEMVHQVHRKWHILLNDYCSPDTWIYLLKSLHHESLKATLSAWSVDINQYPKWLYTDFSNIKSWRVLRLLIFGRIK
jgi:hypothetical protein